MRNQFTPLAAAMCALALAAASCSEPGIKNGPLSGFATKVGDSEINDLVELGRERVSFGENDLAVYQVEIFNRSRDAVRVEYRARWFDDDGIEIDDAAQTWRPVFVSAGSSHPVRSVARNMKAVRCVVEIRTHDPATF
jgi:uncharacterized protein YcfL